MFNTKNKGYRTERKIRTLFEKHGWKTIRAGASIGEADLICIKQGKCLFLQVKSTKKKTFYYYGFMNKKLEGVPYYLVVDFGYNRIRILPPRKIVQMDNGEDLKMFLQRFKI